MRHWAAPFVLAMLVLRALVPAGFMLAPVNGGLAIVVCDADATASLYRHPGVTMSAGGMTGQSGHAISAGGTGQSGDGMSDNAMSAADMDELPAAQMSGYDMPMGGMGSHDMSGHPGRHTHPDPTCPYAQSSGATPIPLFAAVTPTIESAPAVLPEAAEQTHAHFGPTRQQSPRGPPHLA